MITIFNNEEKNNSEGKDFDKYFGGWNEEESHIENNLT